MLNTQSIRAFEEARGFAALANGQLVAMDGFDFETFTEKGHKLPWEDDLENHPGLASYSPAPFQRKHYSTPDEAPVRKWRGWQTLEGEMQEVVGAIYAPDYDADGRWGCVVSCPPIVGLIKRISGIDPEQSLELAEWFLIDLWNHFIEPKVDRI